MHSLVSRHAETADPMPQQSFKDIPDVYQCSTTHCQTTSCHTSGVETRSVVRELITLASWFTPETQPFGTIIVDALFTCVVQIIYRNPEYTERVPRYPEDSRLPRFPLRQSQTLWVSFQEKSSYFSDRPAVQQ
jgi:hypothetical protein